MFKTTVKGLLAHKLRLALSALAVVFGVGLMAGTLILTDTLNHTFTVLFGELSAGKDVIVQSKPSFKDDNQTREPVPEALLSSVKAVDGVAGAEGAVAGYAQIVGKDGKAVKPSNGAPSIGTNFEVDRALSSSTLVEGNAPTAGDQMVMDKNTADTTGYKIGDRVRVLLVGPARDFTVTGIVKFGSSNTLAGASLSEFETRTAQEIFDRVGQFDAIEVRAAKGVNAADLRDRIGGAIPERYEAVTGQDQAKQQADAVNKQLGFFKTFLLVFAAIALFVGSFIIINTFSILVAQRTRELALLRALGASRAQVRRSVLAEAVVVGLVGSALGIAFGVLLAIGLKALISSTGGGLPSSATQFLARTVLLSLAVGTIITVIAAVFPSFRAARVAPVAAMRDAEPTSGSGLGRRILIGGVVTVVGVGLLVGGLFGGAGIQLVGLGALISFIGLYLLVPLVARPMAQVLGVPQALLQGASGRMGRANAMRNPRRTAATASALMVGLALVVAVGTLSSSLKASFVAVFDKSLRVDYVVQNSSQGSGGFSPELAKSLQGKPGIKAVTALRFGQFQVDGQRKSLTAYDPSTIDQTVNIEMVDGSVAALTQSMLLVDQDTAKKNKLKVGSTVNAVFAKSGPQTLGVGGIFKKNPFAGTWVSSLDVYQRNFTNQLDAIVAVVAVPGETAQAKASLDDAAKAFPNVDIKDQTQYKADQKKQVDQLLVFVTALLGLSLLIAVFGIVNTLALSVLERTRELGLLRAVGMQRAQVRRMVRGETVIVSVIGGVLGVVVGFVFGWAVVRALRDQGITEFRIPQWLGLPGLPFVVFLVLAGVAGLVAAIFPAWRASKLNVLEAIATE